MLQLRSNLKVRCKMLALAFCTSTHKIVGDGQYWLLCFIHVRISLSSLDPRCTHLRGHLHDFYILNQTHLRGTQHNDNLWHKVIQTHSYVCFLVQLAIFMTFISWTRSWWTDWEAYVYQNINKLAFRIFALVQKLESPFFWELEIQIGDTGI